MKVIGWNNEKPIIEFTGEEFNDLKRILMGYEGFQYRGLPDGLEMEIDMGKNLQNAAKLFSSIPTAKRALETALQQINGLEENASDN